LSSLAYEFDFMLARPQNRSRPVYSPLVEQQVFQLGGGHPQDFRPVVSKRVAVEGFEPQAPNKPSENEVADIEHVTRKIEHITRNLTTKGGWESDGFAGLINTHILDGYNEFKSPPNLGIAEKHGVSE
jgi:hypothetical protein